MYLVPWLTVYLLLMIFCYRLLLLHRTKLHLGHVWSRLLKGDELSDPCHRVWPRCERVGDFFWWSGWTKCSMSQTWPRVKTCFIFWFQLFNQLDEDLTKLATWSRLVASLAARVGVITSPCSRAYARVVVVTSPCSRAHARVTKLAKTWRNLRLGSICCSRALL